MDLNNVTTKIKSGTLLLDEAKSLLSSTVTNNVFDRTLKDFLHGEIIGITEKAMHVLIIMNELELLEGDSKSLISLYEIPIKKDSSGGKVNG